MPKNLVEEGIDFYQLIRERIEKRLEEQGVIHSTGWVHVSDEYPMESDTFYYELDGVTEMNVTLRLKKRVITFSDGTPVKTIEY